MSEPNDNEMTFWDHLDDLRKTLFRIAAFIGILSLVFFAYMKELFDLVILAPTRNNFFLYEWFNQVSKKVPLFPDFCLGTFQVKVININLSSQFFIHMSTSFWFALVFGFPFIIYQLFLFVKPALHSNEQKNAGWAFFFGNILFFIGIFVGYILVFPLTLRFLAGYQLSSFIENSVSLDSYMDSFMMLCFMMGLVFELPLLSWFLSQIGILHRGFFTKFRKHAIVILLIVAAVVTPTGDPFTLMVVFLPIYALWEISALVVKRKLIEIEKI
ncbi:MAG TPA: twin-arginine translocase subunit TatC [Paludibacter sp.]|nr:twin-arginine translocase subunit TatC [Paludibacter sp.]